MTVSGKYVILGILSVALVAAGTSWWFRYNATRRSANFWGAESSLLIRDADFVAFSVFSEPVVVRPAKVALAQPNFSVEPQVLKDVTDVPGLLHLRHALLEDRSFKWPEQSFWEGGEWENSKWPNVKWTHALVFTDKESNQSTYLLFAPESKLVTWSSRNGALSYEPIAGGVAEMFGEFERLPTLESAQPVR